MNTTEVINQDRRRLLSTAAASIVVASAVSLLPSQLIAAPAGDAIRPFRVNIPEAQLVDLRRRIAATQWPDQETVSDGSQGPQLECVSGDRSLLGHRLRLAKGGSASERAADVHHRDRRRRHSLHPRSFEARQCVAAHRDARMARLGHRAIEDHRPAHQPHRARRKRVGRLPSRDPVDPRLWLLGQAEGQGLGSRAHRPRLGGADEAARLHPLCRPGRRLGLSHFQRDGAPGAGWAARHPHQPAGDCAV